jgi:hypothetical protein
VEAVHYSLDGQLWQRSPGDKVALHDVPVGAHQLLVAAENSVGNVDTHPVALAWATGGASTENRSLFLLKWPDAGTTVGSSASFEVGGWSAGSFFWRVDGGAWILSDGTPVTSLRMDTVGVHFWEALPTNTSDSLWTGPPLFYMWSVVDGSSADVLRLTLAHGGHHIVARATDAAGTVFI